MKTRRTKVEADNLKNSKRSERNLWNKVMTLFVLSMLILSTSVAFAHCDTMEGPLVLDAKKAINQNNVNIVLKWIPVKDEAELKDAFTLAMKVRALSPEAKELADKSFFETLVRIHRTGEGVAFTGVKPVGMPIDEKIKAADKSIEVGNLSPLDGLVSKDEKKELTDLFNKVMSLKNYDVNDVDAGREYIEAYVHFFKFAEGEGHKAHGEAHAVKGVGSGHAETDVHETHLGNHLTHIPWILTVLFFITTTVFASLYLKKKNR
jgi:hypothetical protein